MQVGLSILNFAKRHKFSVSLNPGLQVSHLMRTAMTLGIRHVGQLDTQKLSCWAFSTKKMERLTISYESRAVEGLKS